MIKHKPVMRNIFVKNVGKDLPEFVKYLYDKLGSDFDIRTIGGMKLIKCMNPIMIYIDNTSKGIYETIDYNKATQYISLSNIRTIGESTKFVKELFDFKLNVNKYSLNTYPSHYKVVYIRLNGKDLLSYINSKLNQIQAFKEYVITEGGDLMNFHSLDGVHHTSFDMYKVKNDIVYITAITGLIDLPLLYKLFDKKDIHIVKKYRR